MAYKDRHFLWTIALCAALTYLLWAIVIPYNQAPDEYLRYDIPRFIYRFHSLPVAGDPRLFYPTDGVTYAALPCLGYILGGLLMIVFGHFVSPENVYMIPRLVSVASGTIAVILVYKICSLLNIGRWITYFVTGVFTFIPEYAFVNAYVNLDSMAVCVGAYITYAWIKGATQGWSRRNIITLGIGVGLCLLSYVNGYVYLPVTLLVLVFTCSRLDRETIGNIVRGVVVAVLISGWWFLRSAWLYHGDIFGWSTTRRIAEIHAIQSMKPSVKPTLQSQGYSVLQMFEKTGWFEGSFNSFWAAFGYMDIWLNGSFYSLIGFIYRLSLIGSVIIVIERFRRSVGWRFGSVADAIRRDIIYIGLTLVVILTFGLSVFYSFVNDFEPQGRYLYPALFPIILFAGLGLGRLFAENVHKYVFSLGIILMMGANFYSLFAVLLPRYA